MKSFILCLLFLALQSISLVWGLPLQERQVIGPPSMVAMDPPSVESIKEAIAGKVRPGRSIFWTASTNGPMRRYAQDHDLQWVTQTDRKDWGGPSGYYNDPMKWNNWDETNARWSEAFAELASGTVWIMFKDLSPIDPNPPSVWNKREYPALKRPGVEEIIQLNRNNFNEQIQIWPVNVRDFPKDKCDWSGNAPVDCRTSCPDDTHEVARSRYGAGKTPCQTNHILYCCKD